MRNDSDNNANDYQHIDTGQLDTQSESKYTSSMNAISTSSSRIWWEWIERGYNQYPSWYLNWKVKLHKWSEGICPYEANIFL